MKLTMYRFLGVLAACTMTLTLAASTTYTYTGNVFQTVLAPYTTSDFVSGYFTLTSPLPVNMAESAITPVSYSFTDGVQTFSSASPPPEVTFNIGTDASGNIDQWVIQLDSGPPSNDIVSTSSNASDFGELGIAALGENFGDSGTWVTSGGGGSPTPEPGNVALVGLGLAAIGVVRRKVRMERPLREPLPPE